LGAEIARVVLSDDEGAKKRVEQAMRVMPGDPRAHVQRFCEALAAAESDESETSDGAGPSRPTASKIKIPAPPELGPPPAAAAQVPAPPGLPPATPSGKAAGVAVPASGSTYE